MFTFKEHIENSRLQVKTDNQNVPKILAKGSIRPDLQKVALSVFEFCKQNKISIYPVWIPREENQESDEMSKICDKSDWYINPEIFRFLNSIWGNFTIDRFATYYNCQTSRFNSRWWNPGTEAVDAFSQDWSQDINWVVPPVNMIKKALDHCLNCRAVACFVVPVWKSSYFWSFIHSEKSGFAYFIWDVKFLGNQNVVFPGRFKNELFERFELPFEFIAIRILRGIPKKKL